jgi:hypothetical protein
MTKARLDGLCLLLLGSAIFVLAGSAMERMTSGSMEDFKAVYYGSRCLLQHCDPYSESDLLRVYLAEGGERPSDALQRGQRQGITVCVYPPAAFIFIAPFALLPWGPAHALWMILIAGSFILAAFLMWNTGASHAPVISGGLIALLLVNSMSLLMIGNAAGVVVSLCAVAVWCFIEERFAAAGVLCLAACLAIKPHDAGLVWLYFLLAGGVYRKRALQTLAVTAALAIPAVVWVGQVAPHWMRELNSNLATLSAPGGLNSPDPTTASTGTAAMVVNLQSVVSVFRDDPRLYTSVSYLVCGALLLVWSVMTLRSRPTPARAWLALAAVSALTMLATYHRPYDAKLLLLTVPACAMLWAEGGPMGWLALLVNTAGFVLTGDIPLALLVSLTRSLHVDTAGLPGKMLTVVLARPAPLMLLAMSVFYLIALQRLGVGQGRNSAARRPTDKRRP